MKERVFKAPRVRKSTDAQLRSRKRYAERHPEKIKAARQANAESLKIYNAQKRERLRLETLSYYGPRHILGCSWADCPIVDPDMLVLDHTADNGAEQRKTLKLRGWNFYTYLKNIGFPSGYQTLCCNHNIKKERTRTRISQVSD